VAACAVVLAGCTTSGCDVEPCPPGSGSVAAIDSSGAQAWRTTIEDRSDEPPQVSGDFVVVDGCRAVHVIDARTGQLIRSTEDLADTVGVLNDRVYGAEAGGTAGAGAATVRGVALDDTGSERSISHAGGTGGPGFARTMVIARGRLMGTQGDQLIVYAGEGAAAARVQLPVVPETKVLPVERDRAVTGAPDGSVVGVDLAALRLTWRVVPEQVSRRYALGLRAAGRIVLVSALGSAPPPGSGPAGSGSPRTHAAPVAEAMAVSAQDGRVLWRRKGLVVGAATGTVAVLLGESAVVALDLRTGEQLWTRRSPALEPATLARAVSGRGTQPAVVVDGTVALTDLADLPGTTLGVDARTGRELWKVDGPSEPVPLEVAFGVLHGARAPGGTADQPGNGAHLVVDGLDPRTGETVWSATVRAERPLDAHPWQLLSADPARSQTILLDLPATVKGGCG
jgi:outer membrane protein assembly factor BamB